MSSKKILIVDDETDVVTYLSAVLEANGYESYAANNIKTALKKVKEIQPALICLDIVMPNETGISFYVKIKQTKDFKEIPVIIISGIIESENFDFNSFVKVPAIPPPECFMEKPINVEKFIQKIEQLIN